VTKSEKKTLKQFRKWCAEVGHYASVEAVDRHLKMKESK